MDVQFSPTGEELVTASYDRTLRIWKRDQGHSREVYHTKRMQRLFAARWTPDSKYVLSGSDDGNVSFNPLVLVSSETLLFLRCFSLSLATNTS
jgi:WD40 repeat protein